MTAPHTDTSAPPTGAPVHDFDTSGHIWKVGGPPGTGKTTWMTSTAARLLERGMTIDGDHYALPGDMITVVSFTRAGAKTARERLSAVCPDIPERNIATLHSMATILVNEARRDAGETRTRFARDAASCSIWNARHPELRITPLGDAATSEAGAERTTPTDEVMSEISRLRGLLLPEAEWPEAALAVHHLWETFKQTEGLSDFTDLLEAASELTPPGIMLMFVDEAQDLSPLELALLRRWATCVARVAFIGDDDQAIYEGLKGAAGSAFVDLEADPGCTLVLEQSWRVPRAVHRLATATTSLLQHRWAKTYTPRDVEGVLGFSEATYEDPEALLPWIEAVTARGEDVMILGYARHMLDPIIRLLDERTLEYHNPYAQNGAWNAIPTARKGAHSARDRVLAWMDPGHDPMKHWIALEWLTDTFVRGTRDDFEGHIREDYVPGHLETFLQPEAHAAFLARDLDFFETHLSAKARERGGALKPAWRRALALARQGLDVLTRGPRIVVGTIHSVKGAEAEHVALFPDIPDATQDLDEALRVMYVGMTRTKNGLVLCRPCNERALPLEDIARAMQRQVH